MNHTTHRPDARLGEVLLPHRRGPRPSTTAPTRQRPFPHQQTDQRAPDDIQELLFQRARALPDVHVGRSLVSLPESRAFHLDATSAGGPPAAFQRGTEFAHIHTDNDNSLHLTLPPGLYEGVQQAGWGEPHPISGTMMLFGPRDHDELEVVWQVVQASWAWARTGDIPTVRVGDR